MTRQSIVKILYMREKESQTVAAVVVNEQKGEKLFIDFSMLNIIFYFLPNSKVQKQIHAMS